MRPAGSVEDLPAARATARYRILVALLAVTVLVPVTAITFAGIFRDARPDIVLRMVPFDAAARAAHANRMLLADRSRATADEVLNLTRAAFSRDGTVVFAITAGGIALGIQGRSDAALGAFHYSERLSRRDLQTQLALIEHQVAAGSISGALLHYDTILRSSNQAKQILYPILTSASTDPAIARQVNKLLRRKPIWWRDYLTWFLGASHDAVATAIIPRGLLDLDVEEDRALALRQLRLLTEARRFDLVWSTYRSLVGSAGGEALLRDGDFETDRGLPPFDWRYAESGDLNPERRPLLEGSGSALYLPTQASSDGEVAGQLLRLRPGGYELRAQVGNVPSDPGRRPYIQIVCASTPGRQFLRAAFSPAQVSSGVIGARFTVPANCPYQWISISVRAGLDTDLTEAPWIASVSLQRI